MTQKSWPWSTVAGLGDGVTALGESDSRLFLATWFGIQSPVSEGVSKGVGLELAVSGVASPLSVATGSAICYGLYINDATVTLAVATPAIGTTGGRVVLQTNWAGTGGAGAEARTRLVAKISADGSGAIPALTQVVGTTWEISLATFTITTGGVITVTDDRTFRKPTTLAGTTEIADLAISSAKIADNGVLDTKLRDSGALSVIGRAANSSGDPADISAGSDTQVLRRSGTTLAFGQIVTGGVADDAVDDTKVGNRVPQFYRRQGGSATNWSTKGTSTQTPTSVRMQGGVIELTVGIGGNTGAVTVTFPTAFSNVPIALLTIGSAQGDLKDIVIDSISATQLAIRGNTTGSAGERFWNIHWLVIGPE